MRSYYLRQHFIPEGLPCDSGALFPDGKPDSVTIHWIGPYPGQTPDIVRSWWMTGGGEASAHLVIKDTDVLQCWPFDKVCWHCGSYMGNWTSLAVEVVPASVEGEFSSKSILALKGVLDDFFPDLPLKRHYDWNGKDCPSYYINDDLWLSLKIALGRG